MNWARVLGAFGLLLYLGTGVFPYLASGLLVPAVGLIVLWAAWGFGAVWAWKTFARRPLQVLWFPVAAVAFWFLYLTVGERLFGWTA